MHGRKKNKGSVRDDREKRMAVVEIRRKERGGRREERRGGR